MILLPFSGRGTYIVTLFKESEGLGVRVYHLPLLLFFVRTFNEVFHGSGIVREVFVSIKIARELL